MSEELKESSLEQSNNQEALSEVQKENEATKELQEESIESLKEKIKELEDKYIRVHADFENTKKRLEKEKYQLLDYAQEKFAKDLLPVIDSLEMALANINQDVENPNELLGKLKEGISLTLDNFIKVFKNHGIEPISAQGIFDPHLHEAIMQTVSQTHEDGEIIAVLQKGYKYKERILRPALVNVCKK